LAHCEKCYINIYIQYNTIEASVLISLHNNTAKIAEWSRRRSHCLQATRSLRQTHLFTFSRYWFLYI